MSEAASPSVAQLAEAIAKQLAAQQVAGITMERVDDQAALLLRARDYFDQCSADTLLVGHNIRHFDLPKLRYAMIRHGVRLPPCLVGRDQPIFDTMVEWNRYTLDERPMVSLTDVLDACGMPNHKHLAQGAMVPELYERGEHATILAYAAADVVAEWSLFLRMTGQAGDLAAQAADNPDNTTCQPVPVARSADGQVESLLEEFRR